jgi:hypothetical protein
MASKWGSLKNKIEPFALEQTYQARVDEVKKTYVGLDTAELAREFAAHRRIKREHEDVIKDENTELEALSQLLVADLESSDIQKVTLATGETTYISSEPYSTVADKVKMLAYLRKAKMQELLSLNFQTMNALNKERLAAGKEPLPGTVVYLKTSARVRGGGETE